MIFGHKAASIPSYTDFFNQGEVYNYFPCKERNKEMNVQEAYKVMQAASDIEVGDTVRILRRYLQGEMGVNFNGCDDCYINDAKMRFADSHAIGKVLKTDHYGENNGILITSKEWDFTFPFFALEIVKKAKKAKKEKMVDVDGTMWSLSSVKAALRKHAE